jgi:hypothetical protein
MPATVLLLAATDRGADFLVGMLCWRQQLEVWWAHMYNNITLLIQCGKLRNYDILLPRVRNISP